MNKNRWLRLEYKYGTKIQRYLGSFNKLEQARDIFDRLGTAQESIISLHIDGIVCTTEDIARLFEKISKLPKPQPKGEEEEMKNGKKPNKNQKIAIQGAGLKPENWLVVKNLQQQKELHIVHRTTGNLRVIPA